MTLTPPGACPTATASAHRGTKARPGAGPCARGPANGDTYPAALAAAGDGGRPARAVAPAPALAAADDDGRPARAVVRHARWVALATGGGVAAHLGMAADGGWMASLALAMAAVCAPCAWGMWRRPSVRGARILVGMSLAMALAHVVLVLGVMPLSAMPLSEHVHGGSFAPSTGVAAAADAALAHASHVGPVLLIVGVDLAAALIAAGWLRRMARWG